MGEFLARRALGAAAIGLVTAMLLGGCDATGAYSVINCRAELAKVQQRYGPLPDSILSMTEDKLGYLYDDGSGTIEWHWVDYDSKSGRCVVSGETPFGSIARD